MATEIYFAGPDSKPLLTTSEYDANRTAHALTGNEPRTVHIAGFVEVDLDDGYRVLVNPATVTYLRNVNP